MNYYDLEFSFRAHVSQEAAFQAFAICLDSPDTALVTYNEYINLMDLAGEDFRDKMPPYVGLELLWDEKGFKTLMRGIYFDEEMSDNQLEEICYCLAKQLDTEVAIGDFIHTDYVATFLVYTPSGERWLGADAGKGYNDLVRVEYGGTEEQNGVNDRE